MEVEKMSSVGTSKDGDDVILPGFRFHPTEEELLGFYLRRKVQKAPISIQLFKQIDLYKYDPWDLPRNCARGRSHDWTECPFAHPGEKARRSGPRKYNYSGTARPEFPKGNCKKGNAFEFADGVFDCRLHPAGYGKQPCKDGTNCRRRVCFFAHTPDELRVLSPRMAGSAKAYDGSPHRLAFMPSLEWNLPASESPPSKQLRSEADIEQERPTELNSGFSLRLSDDDGRGSTVEQQPSEVDIELGLPNQTENSDDDDDDDDNDNETEKLMKMLVNGQSNGYWLKLMMMFLGFNIAHLAFSSLAKAELPSPIAGGLNAFGFYATLIAIILYPKKKEAALILGKIGISATTSGIIVASGLMFLPHNIFPIIFLLCFIVCIVIALA